MTFRTKYGLSSMLEGETKRFTDLSPQEHTRIKRSAHNYNVRSNMYFTTRFKDGVLFVTRIK